MNYVQRKFRQRRVRRIKQALRQREEARKQGMTAQKVCKKCGGMTFIGVEIRGVYDGVLFWVCEACRVAMPRDWGSWEDMQAKSDHYAEGHNALLAEQQIIPGSNTEPHNPRGEPA